MTQFKIDLEMGNKAEKAFAYLLTLRGNQTCIAYGYNPGWDIAVIENRTVKYTYEVKYDIVAERSGNVALEIAFKGQKSGLEGTLADYMVFFVKDRFYVADTKDLREWVNVNKEHLKQVKGGDNDNSDIILMPYKYLDGLNFVERIDIGEMM